MKFKVKLQDQIGTKLSSQTKIKFEVKLREQNDIYAFEKE